MVALTGLSFYGKTRQEAADKLAKAMAEKQNGTFVEPSLLTVGKWLDSWLEDYKKLDLRQTTWESYETTARTHLIPSIGHIPLKDLRAEHLQHLYNEKLRNGLSARTVRYIHQVIHGALKQAVKNGLVARNVSEATSLPKEEKREARALTREEQDRFLSVPADDRLGAAFLTLLGTGLRRGELLALTWNDVDLKKKTIRVRHDMVRTREKGLLVQKPKTPKAHRSIPLTDDLAAALKAHRARQAQEKLQAGTAYRD